jgi:hypothetical protein
MPNANRHFLPGYVWHITHRCKKAVSNRSKCSNRSIAALRSRRLIKIKIRSSANSEAAIGSPIGAGFRSEEALRFIGANYLVTCNTFTSWRKMLAEMSSQSIQLIAGRSAR